MSRCFFKSYAPEGMRECDGPVDRHHVITRQAIKRTFPRVPSYATDEQVRSRKADLEKALRDDRNLLTVCRRHHELFHGARFSVPADALPGRLWDFAVVYGLEYELERQFGERSGRVV